MATIIRVNVQDLNDAFFKELGEHLTDASQVEIHIQPPQKRTPLLSETDKGAAWHKPLKLLSKTILGRKVHLRLA